jgi:indolepyruvate decarboxylase
VIEGTSVASREHRKSAGARIVEARSRAGGYRVKTQTIGEFLLRRLEEAGVHHVFGVAGDYELEFLQQLEDRGRPAWIGNCNELNASYAADGYARVNGIAALVVTHGVGALSAMNGIAGSFCEHVPVICICGSIPRKAVERGLLLHHTLEEGSHREFYRAFAQVTAAQAQLTPANAASEIDRMIRTAWTTKRPVYLELPSDIAYLQIEVPEAPLKLVSPPSDSERLKACTEAILERLSKAKSPALLLDLEADRFHAIGPIKDFAEKAQIPVATLCTSKATFSEQSPLFAGLYTGAGSPPNLRKTVEESDCLLAVGYRRVDTNSGGFSDHLPEETIWLRAYSADIGEENFQAITLAEVFERLAAGVPSRAPRGPAATARAANGGNGGARKSDKLTQEAYWRELQTFIRPGDVIIAEDGTSSEGGYRLALPEGCTFISQTLWGSIGYSVGALLGTLLAAPERRHVLLVGDGSFQMTAQALSTILRHDLKPIIFLINNGGYAVERAIVGKNAKYNDVANWRYADLPKVFSRTTKAKSYVVRNVKELRSAIARPHDGLVFVEAVMDAVDVPAEILRGGRALANQDYGSRGPQSRPGAQLSAPPGGH